MTSNEYLILPYTITNILIFDYPVLGTVQVYPVVSLCHPVVH